LHPQSYLDGKKTGILGKEKSQELYFQPLAILICVDTWDISREIAGNRQFLIADI